MTLRRRLAQPGFLRPALRLFRARPGARVRSAIGLVLLFGALTVFVTWPLARTAATQAVPHHDVYFNMWRLAWFAHTVPTDPARLFDANIFYPERRTLALSDAMIVEGTIAAPLFWLKVRPVLIHNLMLFGAMALCGAAMFVLAHHLTGSRGAGVLAGIVFALAPYRFEHAMHMELQWAMWSPLALWALHRTIREHSWKFGFATGAFVLLQLLSSLYYGLFLATLLPIVGGLLLLRNRGSDLRRGLPRLAAGAILAGSLCALYAIPYLQARQIVGERPHDEVIAFSARPSSYLVATPDNQMYGNMFRSRGRSEARLFPGTTVVVLAIIGLLLRDPPDAALIYLIGLVAAFDLSLGFSGYLYPVLYRYVGAYHGLRAAARAAVFVLMFLSVLGAYGYECLVRDWGPRRGAVLFGALALFMLAEYRVKLPLTTYANTAPPLYRVLREQPRGVVLELPVPRPETLAGPDPAYVYASTFHWFPLTNGYSGMYPPSYLLRLDRLSRFPNDRALRQLALDNVRYVIVHEGQYPGEVLPRLLEDIQRTDRFVPIGTFLDSDDPSDRTSRAILYRFR